MAPVHALILVDVQRAFVEGDGAIPDAARVLAGVDVLLRSARAAAATVVHLQNDGPAGAVDEPDKTGWELRSPVAAGELIVRKSTDDGFESTSLGAQLDKRAIRSVAICGVMSEMCVAVTARTALARGLRVVLPHDAHGTYDIPAADGTSERVAAAMVSRVVEWSLGDQIHVVPTSDQVTFVPG